MDELLKAPADVFAAAVRQRLASARDAVEAFKALPAETTADQAVAAWDGIDAPLNGVSGLVHLYVQVHPDGELREVAEDLEQELSRFGTELSLDRALYDRLAAIDAEALADPVARRLVEHGLRDFRRAGVDREESVRERVRALRSELVELSQAFSRNIAGDVRSVRVPAEALEGLPDDWVASHPADDDGLVTVTTNPPDAMPFLKYSAAREHRAALYKAYASRAAPDNFDVLSGILERRHELAGLLGYAHWADYATEDKMIRSAERAREFIGRVTELTRERAEQELGELVEALREAEPGADVLRHHDHAWIVERVRRDRFDFDTREARAYFGYEAVLGGVLETAERLYGLVISRADDAPVWHPDVCAYDVTEGGTLVARFWLDMHPRDDKFKHAAMFDLASGVADGTLPSACLVCNVKQPTESDPALLDPGDVKTLFHEFGHLLHHLLAGRQRYLGVSGIATEWDFVEVPSQLFEEWATKPEILARFATHHETGKPIPAELVERMNRAAEYGKGVGTRTQMFYAALSLGYHDRDPTGLDTTAFMRELKPQYVPFPHEEGTAFQAAFGHLDGYSAIYYTYMWSLVLAKDCLAAFGDDLMDADVARRWRDAVLAPGGSRDAEDLLAEFLGRPYSFEAFEAWLAA